jgi:N-acetylglucosamine malate deacetylase 1
MNSDIPQVDVLAIGAHPDDADLGVGGIIAKYARTGARVAILDLTRGELATRGAVDLRAEEAAEAARILGVMHRGNAALPDGAIASTTVQQHAVIPWIRQYRPKLILCQVSHDRHPDHRRTFDLVRDANFFAGLRKIGAPGEPYRAPQIYYYAPYYENIAEPSMVIDITETFDAKLEALRAYRSQFYNPEFEGEETYLSTQQFWESIRLRAQYWGGRVGVEYGEPLIAIGPVGLPLPPALESFL